MPRLILIIIFFFISLLGVCKAPAYYLWLLAIVVTEYPLIFAGISTILTAWGFWAGRYQMAGTVIGVISILLYLSPIIRAQLLSEDLREGMSASFTGNGTPPVFPGRKVFSFGKLFTGVPAVGYQTRTYAKYADVELTLDYYAPPKSSPRGRTSEASRFGSSLSGRPGGVCVIVIHGGSWSSGDSKQLPELNYYLAGRGYNVAAINYRMAPKYQTPAPVEDVKQALDYLTKHAEELHIDTSKFVLLGRSAGAQIALLAAYTLHDKRIKGVVDFYGPADMVWGYSVPSNPLIMDSRKVMENYIGCTYQQGQAKYVACSPLEFADTAAVPTLIIHGDNDVLVSPEHSRRLNLKLQQHNIRHYWLKLPWATHGFDYNLNGPGGQLSTFAVETFLNTITQ
ncbi:alpha/beta hydrolase [Mucilaginibacter mali]|uniref:Alpha/beta hydrolase n=1 Tax=Mucilaginibacter mali TaxID=2740462 RepID=A0A7D4PWD4_9SPHI|nr:alpha/beta hydrolase [Mucilaginibacter mali]QKJ32328.1 alpha/beta hydrolase [Mucilaginibacter mali]